jgi:hypothetical protein
MRLGPDAKHRIARTDPFEFRQRSPSIDRDMGTSARGELQVTLQDNQSGAARRMCTIEQLADTGALELSPVEHLFGS